MARTVIVARDPLVAEEAALARLPHDVPVRRWHASELSLDLIFAQLGSSDLFATRQSYLYVNVLDLKLKKADAERLESILARIPAEIDLACTHVFSDLAYRDEERLLKGADLQRWERGARLEDLRRVSDAAQAPRWLLARAGERHGLKLTPQQAQRILLIAGGKLSLAEGELRKLSLLTEGAGPSPRPSGEVTTAGRAQVPAPSSQTSIPSSPVSISDSQIEVVLAASPAAQYWELVDAIMGDQPDALARLRQWHDLEPEGFRLLSELRRRLLGLRALSLGQSVQPPFFAQQLARIARRWPPPRLAGAIEQLAELEFRLKSGMIPGESSKDAELSALEVFTRGLTARS